MRTASNLKKLYGAALAVLVAGCGETIVDDFGVAGFAQVEGRVERPDGSAFSGDVFVSCGVEEPGFFGTTVATSEPGWYSAVLEFPDESRRAELAANDYRATCDFDAPAGPASFATEVTGVQFAPPGDDRVTTRVDLVPEP